MGSFLEDVSKYFWPLGLSFALRFFLLALPLNDEGVRNDPRR